MTVNYDHIHAISLISNCWWSIAEISWRQEENAVSAFWRDGDKILDHNPDHQRRDYRSVRTRANSGDRYELSLRRGTMSRWPDNPSLRFTPLSFIVMCDAWSYGSRDRHLLFIRIVLVVHAAALLFEERVRSRLTRLYSPSGPSIKWRKRRFPEKKRETAGRRRKFVTISIIVDRVVVACREMRRALRGWIIFRSSTQIIYNSEKNSIYIFFYTS